MKRKRRVRLHLIDPHPQASLPSVEGILLGRRFGEYVIALPSLLVAAGGNAAELRDARELRIPQERIAFYEVLK